MRWPVLSVSLLLVASKALAGDPPPDPCAGHTGVVDGVDEDGVVCDGAAQQAALQRFTTATAAAEAAHFVQPPCDPSNKGIAKTKLDGATEWVKAAARAEAGERLTDRQLAALRAALAREKSNPSGVVSLSRLHEIGEDIQVQTDVKTQQDAEAKADRAHAQKLMAETKAALDACKKAKS